MIEISQLMASKEVVIMAEGGFLVKFDEKTAQRCYAVEFDYDEWSYAINNGEKKELLKGIRKISIEIEEP